MIKSRKFFLVSMLGALVLSSCFKEPEIDPEEINKNWETDILAPIMRTRMHLEDAANLSDVGSTVIIDASTINPLWTGPMISPAVSGLSTQQNPNEFGITEYFEKVYTDTLNMTVILTNNLPIAIGKGTILVYRNRESQLIIAKKLLDKDVEPGEEYEFEFLIYNKDDNPPLVESDIQFYLEDFRTEGTKGKIEDFAGTSVSFKFVLNWIKINEILINADKQFTDTLEIGFELTTDTSNTDSLFSEAAEGKLVLYMTSGMPLNILWQMDILGENDEFLMDFGDKDIKLEPAKTNNETGQVLETREIAIEILLNKENIQKFQKAKKIKAIYDINTLGLGTNGVVRVNDNSYIDIQLVADLLVRPGKIEEQ